MQYNFDEIVNRQHTNAMNTDGFRSYIFHAGPEMKFPYADDEFVRMWVADMEFATPPEIREAMKERIDKRIFGYTMVFEPSYYQAFENWCRTKYDYTFPKEQLCFAPGIIPALYELVGDICAPDEKVVIQTPAYGFFKHSVDFNHRELVLNPMTIDDSGNFTIDFDDLEQKAADPKVKLLLFCSPQNPSGRVWKQEELERIAEIVRKNDLWVISDEIHCDLLRQGQTHIPLAKVMPDYDKLITCMATSKTFNMAGMMFSSIMIRNEALRKTFKANDKVVGFVNPISLAATQAAYEHGADWLDQLRTYLDHNFQFVKEFLSEYLPKAVFSLPEATYLAWVDMSAYFTPDEDLPMFFAKHAGVLLEGGNGLFVDNANGYIRLNLAMPRSIIKTGMQRIAEAISKK